MNKKNLWLYLFVTPLLLFFAIFLMVPVAMVIGSSFFEWKGFSGNIAFIGMDNYIAALQDKVFRTAFINTLIWTAVQSTVHVFIGVSVAIIISKKFRGWKIIRTAFVIPNMIAASALGFVFLMVFNGEFGLINTLLNRMNLSWLAHNWLFESGTAFWSVTMTWLIYAGLIMLLVLTEIGTIPRELYEAAELDGATAFHQDIFITLPLLKNVIGTCVIIAATSKLKEFELIYIATKGGPGDTTLNLPLYLYNTAMVQNDYGYSNMIGTVLIALGLVLIYLISKFFRIESNT